MTRTSSHHLSKRVHDQADNIYSQLIQQRRPRDGVTGLETNCFYNRTIETWNELPRNVAEADDITEFKINLDKAWSDMPWKFDHKAETESGS